MRDADATSEHEPTNRISRWESTKGDGVYDKHTVFVDHVMFPRMILAARRQQHPDQRDAFGRRGSILGHEQRWRRGQEGDFLLRCRRRPRRQRRARAERLLWGLDNWIYSTYNAFRFRWTPHGILREPTAPNGASWGLTAGRRREDVVHQRRRGARPGQLPVSDSVRQPDAGRRLRAGLRYRVAGSRDRRHAGRHAARPPAARRTQPLHRDRRRRYRPWRSTPAGSSRRSPVRRAGRAIDPPREDRQDRGVDPTSQRLSRIGVHPRDRSALPAGEHEDRARWPGLHHGHVPRHHPGSAVDAARVVSAREDRAASARQDHELRTRVAPAIRRASCRAGDGGQSGARGDSGTAAGLDAAADAERNAGATGHAPHAPERLVA